MEKQRTIVKFYVRLGKSIEEVTNDLGRQSTEDDQREGRSSTSTTQNQIEEVQRTVNNDPKLPSEPYRRNLTSVWDLWFQFSHENLNMSKVSARWVPQLLTTVHR